ncbi:MAG: BrnT family toxin [Deltaproteobacteria bacterium]|nr:BrnT family toxin [Deltaproteobacteria bacterium]
MAKGGFEWDAEKNILNQKKHGVSFETAQYAFNDPRRIIAIDEPHSHKEKRYYCFGRVDRGIITVRFTYRARQIRIFGAGHWRKGKKIYEKQNHIHRRTDGKN